MPGRILVLDDDPFIIDFYQEILTDEGWTVSVAELGPISSAAVVAHAPDVILLDWMLGNEPVGYDIVRRLKAEPATREIPVLVCTVAAKTMAAVEPELSALGVPIVIKPFQVEEFIGTLQSVLRPAEDVPTAL